MRQFDLSRLFSRLILLFGIAVLSACGGDSVKSPDLPGADLQSIAVSCTPSMLFVGDTGSCTATGTICRLVETGKNDFERECPNDVDITGSVKWRTTDPDVVTVDKNGNITGVGEGTADIVAVQDGVSGRDTVAVTEAPLVSLVAECPPEVFVGETDQCTATGTFENGSVRDVTNVVAWTSADPSLISVNSNNGQIRGEGVDQNPDTVTITATCAPPDCITDTGLPVSDTDDVDVRTANVTGLVVTPDPAEIPPFCTLQYTATASFEGGSTRDVTNGLLNDTVWASNSADASINETGLATAGAMGGGVVTITATFTDEAGNTANDSAALTITDTTLAGALCVEALENATGSPVCNRVDPFIKPSGIDVPFQAKLLYENGTSFCRLDPEDGRVTWSSTNEAVATVNNNGVAHTDADGLTLIEAEFDSGTGEMADGDHPLQVGADFLVDYVVLPKFSCVGFYDVVPGEQNPDELPASQQMRAEGKFNAAGWTCDVDGDGDNDGDAELGPEDFSNDPQRCTGALTTTTTWTSFKGFWDGTQCSTNEETPAVDENGVFVADGSVRLGMNCVQGVPDAEPSLVGGGTVLVLPVTNDDLFGDGVELCNALEPLFSLADGALIQVLDAVSAALEPALVAIFNEEAVPIDSILNTLLGTLGEEVTQDLIGEGGPLEPLIEALAGVSGGLNCLVGGLLDTLLGGSFECQDPGL